jgi:hypothetical protein
MQTRTAQAATGCQLKAPRSFPVRTPLPYSPTITEDIMNVTPVVVAGNSTVHAGRRIGQYASGTPRWAKSCSSSRNDRHEPYEIDAANPITCKRCLASLANAR